VRVYATRGHISDKICGSATESIDQQAGEYTSSIFFGCILFFGRGCKDGYPIANLGYLVLQCASTRNTAVTAIENNYAVLNPRLIGHCHDLCQWHTVVASLHVGRAEIAARCFNVTVASKVKKGNLSIPSKEAFDCLPKFVSLHGISWPSGSKVFHSEIHRTISVPV